MKVSVILTFFDETYNKFDERKKSAMMRKVKKGQRF